MLTAAFVDPIAFHLGPLSVRWYGLIFVSGIMVAIWLSAKASEERGLNPDFLYDLSMFLVPGGILGARLYEVFILSWSYYRLHPSEILAIWRGGLAIHGGVIGAAIAGGIYIWYKKQPFWLWADMIGPGLILAQAIGRWGNFFNQEAYGDAAPASLVAKMPAWLKDGMTIQTQQGVQVMQPTFLYESVWNLACFAVLYAVQKKKPKPGIVFSLYLILYNIGRFIIESIRQDSSFTARGWRIAQVMAVIQIVLGVALVAYFTYRGKRQAAAD